MRSGRRRGGYTYVVVLAWIALAGVGLGITGELWATAAQREREADLLYIGEAFRAALNAYYEQSPGVPRYPATLAALLRDERYPTVRRHLRRIYVDPMTGKAEWGLVRDGSGTIVGVHSLSRARPLRNAHFSRAQEAFAGKQAYAEWVFRADGAVAAPGGGAPAMSSAPAYAPAAGKQGPTGRRN